MGVSRVHSMGAISITAFLFSLTLGFFAPLTIYFTNVREFQFSLNEVLPYLVAICTMLFILISLLLLILKNRLREVGISLIFTLAFLVWLQGNILLWDYGLFDGKDIEWSKHVISGLVDSAIWLGCIAISLVKAKFVLKLVRNAGIGLLIVQLVSTIILAAQAPQVPPHVKYNEDTSQKYVFSPTENVLIIVLDTFQTDVFQEIINNDPKYTSVFDGFTYYRNALGGFPYTYGSIPLILTGKYYDNSIPMQSFLRYAYLSDTSIPKMLKQNGFNVSMPLYYPVYADGEVGSNYVKKPNLQANPNELAKLYDIALFRYSSHFLKKVVYNKQSFLLQQHFPVSKEPIQNGEKMREVSRRKHALTKDLSEPKKQGLRHRDVSFMYHVILQSVNESPNPTFKFFHLHGPHDPLRINESLEWVEMPFTRENYIQQAKAGLNITGEVIGKLKEIGVYDNTLMFVVGDHGYGAKDLTEVNAEWAGQEDESGYSMLPNKRIKPSALPLVLVKPSQSRGELKISDAPVSLADIPATVFSELGIDTKSEGKSILKIGEEEQRKRRYFFYSWGAGGWSWDLKHFPDISEYVVDGYSWLDSSWEPAYKIHTSKGTKLIEVEPYKWGETIEMTNSGNDRVYWGGGWSHPGKRSTRTDGRNASLRLPIEKPDMDVVLEMKMSPYLADGRIDSQRVLVYVQENRIAEWDAIERGVFQTTIPREYLSNGILRIFFKFPDAASPAELELGSDLRTLAVTVEWIRFSKSH